MSATTHTTESEVSILARLLGNDSDQMPGDLARYILNLTFNERDQDRMHDLAVRNQKDALSPAEKEELTNFGKAGDLLAILKSKARRTLGVQPQETALT